MVFAVGAEAYLVRQSGRHGTLELVVVSRRADLAGIIGPAARRRRFRDWRSGKAGETAEQLKSRMGVRTRFLDC